MKKLRAFFRVMKVKRLISWHITIFKALRRRFCEFRLNFLVISPVKHMRTYSHAKVTVYGKDNVKTSISLVIWCLNEAIEGSLALRAYVFKNNGNESILEGLVNEAI